MNPNPDAPRGPSIDLTERLILKLGLTCIWLDGISSEIGEGDQPHVRLALRSIVGRRAIGEKIWFRNERDAGRVMESVLSRCRQAVRIKDGLKVNLPYNQTLEVVLSVASGIAISPILDHDVATTFDSIRRRIEVTLEEMLASGAMRNINREYATLRRSNEAAILREKAALKKAATSKAGQNPSQAGQMGQTGHSPLPSYNKWLVGRLETELLKCTELVSITRL